MLYSAYITIPEEKSTDRLHMKTENRFGGNGKSSKFKAKKVGNHQNPGKHPERRAIN